MKRFVLILLTVMLLCGCKQFRITKHADRPDLYCVAACSFVGPRVGFANTHRDSIIEADIEKDKYGRELFTIQIPTIPFYDMSGGKEQNAFIPNTIKVILQKRDNQCVYYYEDFCFLMETEDGFLPEEVDKLKEVNDWDNPIIEDKCVSRLFDSNYQDINLGLWYNPYRDIERTVKSNFSGTVFAHPVVADSNGKILCGIAAYDEEGFYKSYYVIYDPQIGGVDKETGIMALTSLKFNQNLHEFKIRNGWDFTGDGSL
jgi:hypothetical protein